MTIPTKTVNRSENFTVESLKLKILNKQQLVRQCLIVKLSQFLHRNMKLLGFIIDNKLTFNEYVESLVKLINKKLFAIKNIFYLSFKTKLKFFKTFILPHFDYCASIFIYFNKTVLEKIERHYNACLFNLLNIDLDSKLADAHDIFLE